VKNVVQCHCHARHSFKDGMPFEDELVARAAELEHPGIALTDHGNVFGAADFFKACKEHSIKGMIGMEAYEANVPWDFDLERDGPVFKGKFDSSLPPRYFHLTIWVLEEVGWENLCVLHTESFKKHHKPKNQPLLDRALLAAHSEGLAIGLGCVQSRVNWTLRNGTPEEAYEVGRFYMETFPGRVYGELMGNTSDQIELIRPQRQLFKRLGAPTLGTNDVHYLTQQDGRENGPHHILVQARRWRKKEGAEESTDKSDDGYGQWYGSDEFYLKDESEMLATSGLQPDDVHRSVELLDRVTFDWHEMQKPSPPTAPVPQPGEDQGFDRWLALR
jgi:DNA polymerase-3 subunit alpha